MRTYVQQKTLKAAMEFSGKALHTGDMTSVRVRPADPNSGYRFRRTDLAGQPEVEAAVHNIRDTQLATSLGFNGAAVKTVEHLLSALAGSGIDNALIEVSGDEIPIMDGSAAPFVRGIEVVGIRGQGVPKRMLRVLTPIEACDGDARARLEPGDRFSITFTIEFEHHVVGSQRYRFDYSPEAYRKDIAFARTFGFLKDVQKLTELGLAKGASLDNAVVVGDHGVLNPDGLRTPDEFVRHKVLDTVGDLSLIGIPILGSYTGHKAGHRINRLLMQEVLNRPGHWELVNLEETQEKEIVCRPAIMADAREVSAAM